MFEQLEAAGTDVTDALDGLDPRLMVGRQPAEGIAIVQRIERRCAAARALLTARAHEQHPWERDGYRSFEDWIAATQGTSKGRAKRKAKAAENLADDPEVADALAEGDISEEQADVVADAADKNPESRKKLLDTAKYDNKSHKDLCDEADRAKASAENDKARAERLRKGRTATWGRDREGFWGLRGKWEPHIGAQMAVRFNAEVDRLRADAIASIILGHWPTPEDGDPRSAPNVETGGGRLDLDLNSHTGANPAARPTGGDLPDPAAPATPAQSVTPKPTVNINKELVLVVDLAAYRRGSVNDGETCHIRGVGQVPVEVARSWVDDAFVKAVISDGQDVTMIAHLGRHIPAHLRTALDLTNTTCSVPGCANQRVELDHDRTFADDGVCSLDNLRALCVHHHRQRTHYSHELLGPPGDRTWINANGNVLFADDPTKVGIVVARAP